MPTFNDSNAGNLARLGYQVAGEYETVAASQTAQALGATGSANFLSRSTAICARAVSVCSIRKPAPGGGMSIHSPRTADGAHGDLVSAFVGALWKASIPAPAPRVPAAPDALGTEDFSPFAG